MDSAGAERKRVGSFPALNTHNPAAPCNPLRLVCVEAVVDNRIVLQEPGAQPRHKRLSLEAGRAELGAVIDLERLRLNAYVELVHTGALVVDECDREIKVFGNLALEPLYISVLD